MSPNLEPNNPKHVRLGPVSNEYILEETEMVRRPYEYKSMPGLTPEAERAMNEVLKEMDPNPRTPTVVKKNLGWMAKIECSCGWKMSVLQPESGDAEREVTLLWRQPVGDAEIASMKLDFAVLNRAAIIWAEHEGGRGRLIFGRRALDSMAEGKHLDFTTEFVPVSTEAEFKTLLRAVIAVKGKHEWDGKPPIVHFADPDPARRGGPGGAPPRGSRQLRAMENRVRRMASQQGFGLRKAQGAVEPRASTVGYRPAPPPPPPGVPLYFVVERSDGTVHAAGGIRTLQSEPAALTLNEIEDWLNGQLY